MAQKPTRHLIHIVAAIPTKDLKSMSPRSVWFRRLRKLPMVLILFDGALFVGINLIFFKFAQALMIDGHKTSSWPLISVLLVIGILMAVLSIHFLNLSVKFYDQTDVVPIYNASILVTTMLSGLIIGNEFNLYTGKQLAGVFGGCLICLLGI